MEATVCNPNNKNVHGQTEDLAKESRASHFRKLCCPIHMLWCLTSICTRTVLYLPAFFKLRQLCIYEVLVRTTMLSFDHDQRWIEKRFGHPRR
mmetsp:Transcript_9682/g.15455  ORF Transcript_9682/g.15455 Transcript_9682/m.15455 type:complete len:93 (-) Transcript_9682:1520-1798(-)